MAKRAVIIRLDEDLYKTLHDVMGYKLEKDGRIYFKFHTASKQDWYRQIIQRGLIMAEKEYQEKKKEIESMFEDV